MVIAKRNGKLFEKMRTVVTGNRMTETSERIEPDGKFSKGSSGDGR
jgi:hypothetical protein